MGTKRAFELFPSPLRARMTKHRKKVWDQQQQAALADAASKLADHDKVRPATVLSHITCTMMCISMAPPCEACLAEPLVDMAGVQQPLFCVVVPARAHCLPKAPALRPASETNNPAVTRHGLAGAQPQQHSEAGPQAGP